MPDFECNISGIPVTFPFKPYDVQIDFMSKIMECLEERRPGVLESPTGTGKTLSLLCASLGWLHNKKVKTRNEMKDGMGGVETREVLGWAGNCGKIIYASRTHSQLRQVIRQFNSTTYKHLFKSTVIGSRDHMCINSLVKKETSLSHKNMRCSLLVKQKQCKFHLNVKNIVSSPGLDVMSELTKPEAHKTCCPYYLAREVVPTSDIIFMPYNYLIDLQLHKNFKFNLGECIIIIDEGHNVAKVCEESSSVTLSLATVASCLAELVEEMQQYYDQSLLMEDPEERDYTPDDLVFLQQRLQNLETFLTELQVPQDGIVHRGSYVFDIFSKCGIDSENRYRVVELLTSIGDTIAGRNTSGSFSNKGLFLKRLSDAIESVFSSLDNNTCDKIDSSFKVFIEYDKFNENLKNRNKKVKAVVLNYWCFDPGFLLRKLLEYNLRSIIITSGTLSPLHAVVEELGFKNAVTLSSRHIVQPFQVLLCTLARGPMNYELKCTYSNREDKNYWRELGMTITNLSRHVPNGLLVFFPSYTTMKKAHELWSESGLLSQLSSLKTVFMEPNNKDEMEGVLSNYSLAVDNNTNGAILFGVCRGKISEGLDFSGKYARGVIVTGIPYAPPKDRRVLLKREFIDVHKDLFKDLTGEVWYHIDAMRAINQAIGRAIRHSADYGVIVLCDSRFHKNINSDRRLPSWLLPYLNCCSSFGSAIQSIKGFFKSVEEKRHLLDYVPGDMLKDAIVNQDEDKILSLVKPLDRSSQSSLVTLTSMVATSSTPRPPLKHIPLYNRAVLETKITRDTQIQVKPAKKRKIKITNTEEGVLSDIRRSQVKSFILDVKLTLDEQSYATFAFIVKKYNQTNDFDETLEALKTLFLSPNEGCEELFRGCYRLFSETHRVRFDQCLLELLDK